MSHPPSDYDPIGAEAFGPLVAALGISIVEWREGFVALGMETPDIAFNRHGVIHGGAMMSLLDTAAGYAGVYCPYPGRYRRAFTLSLSTNFIRAASGGRLRAEGATVGGGRNVFFSEARAFDEDGVLLATASGAFKYRGESGALQGDPRPGSDAADPA